MSSAPRVIVICGPKNHGKDTLANWFVAVKDYKKLSFADGLKQTVAFALQVPIEYMYDEKMKDSIHEPSGHTYRHFLQQVGTECFRGLWMDTWVNWWKSQAMKYEKVVCPDMRFMNEYEAGMALDPNAVSIRVTDDRKPVDNTHASESSHWDIPVTYKVHNDKDLTFLYESAQAIAELEKL